MKKVMCIFLVMMLFIPNVFAQKGCCSHHGGVSGCSSSGRTVCNDGTLSKTCKCTPSITYTYGCTDKNAINYDSEAEKDDNSCEYPEKEETISKPISEENELAINNNYNKDNEEDSSTIWGVIGTIGIGAIIFSKRLKK